MDRSIVRCNFPGVKDWLVREKRGILRSKIGHVFAEDGSLLNKLRIDWFISKPIKSSRLMMKRAYILSVSTFGGNNLYPGNGALSSPCLCSSMICRAYKNDMQSL